MTYDIIDLQLLTDGHSLPNHAMKETDLSRSDIHFGKADKNEFQREEVLLMGDTNHLGFNFID